MDPTYSSCATQLESAIEKGWIECKEWYSHKHGPTQSVEQHLFDCIRDAVRSPKDMRKVVKWCSRKVRHAREIDFAVCLHHNGEPTREDIIEHLCYRFKYWNDDDRTQRRQREALESQWQRDELAFALVRLLGLEDVITTKQGGVVNETILVIRPPAKHD
jgi:hypothetical protein